MTYDYNKIYLLRYLFIMTFPNFDKMKVIAMMHK